MAYGALVSLARVLEQILSHDEDYIHLCPKKQMKSLHSNVVFLQKLLEDIPGSRSSSSKSVLNELESRITDVAYHVEDIIACETSDRSDDDVKHFSRLRGAFSKMGCFKQVDEDDDASLRGMFSTFGSCIGEVSSIVKEAMKSKRSSGKDNHASTSSVRRRADSGKVTMVGLERDLIQLKDRLTGFNTTLQFIPIVGMGGIGKTTLARIVYEDQLTVEHFHIRSWVTVPQDHEYDEEKILLEILQDEELQPYVETEELIGRVYQRLKGRRFIIVMDDMWNAATWDSVRRAIPDDKNGSRVILTTRHIDVAAKVDPSSCLHKMQLLDENQSWDLFQKEVYGQDCCASHLENTGRTVSKNCRGLPLTIVVIARLLKLNKTQDCWQKFACNINQAAAETQDDQIFGILALSYENLPPHLRACFLYMSMFPEDYKIPRRILIWLWVAEGFLKPKRDKSMEEVAGEYLEDLVERNLIFVTERRSNGQIKTCSIHDVLRELSIRKAQEEHFLKHFMCRYADKSNSTTVYQRRVSVTATYIPPPQYFSEYKPVHTLLFHNPSSQQRTFETLKLLRVLDAYNIGAPYVHFDMFRFSLVNLRYLSLSYLDAPDGLQLPLIFNLRNLEILILRPLFSDNLLDAPRNLIYPIHKLPRLRHFYVSRMYPGVLKKTQIDEISDTGSISSSLQTLSGLTNIVLSAGTVGSLKALIKLKVMYCYNNPSDLSWFCLGNLVHLRQLAELNLSMCDNKSSPQSLLATVAFPRSIKKLTLACSLLSWENMSVIGSLPNLEVFKLSALSLGAGCEWEPVEGQFMKLKYLKLSVRNLEIWRVEKIHFPCLEQLRVFSCEKLKELPTEVGEIYTLKELVVAFCPKCVGDSARRIQEEQESYGHDELEVVITDQRTEEHESYGHDEVEVVVTDQRAEEHESYGHDEVEVVVTDQRGDCHDEVEVVVTDQRGEEQGRYDHYELEVVATDQRGGEQEYQRKARTGSLFRIIRQRLRFAPSKSS